MRTFILRRTITALLTLTAMLSLNSLQAQRRFDETMMTDVNGKPIYIRIEYLFEGTPYFPEEYTKAAIILNSGKTYADINSRMNLHENALNIKMNDGMEVQLGGNVFKVIFELMPVDGKRKTAVFQRGFPAIDNFDSTTYYEVLDSGKLKFLKHYKVTYHDKRGFGEGSVTRVFTKSTFYYVVWPGNIIKQLGKGKEEFLSVLPDKKAEVEKYMDNKKLKCKKEEDWIDLVSYYNSIGY